MDTNSYTIYMRELRKKSKPLDKQVESNLIKKAKKGDKYAREVVITANLLWAVKMAKSYSISAPIEDLIQEANVALCIALDLYEDTGNKFYTYATNEVRRHLYNFANSGNKMIYMPLNVVKGTRKLLKFKENFLQKNGRFPTSNEIKKEGIKYHYNITITSTDKPITEDGLKLEDVMGENDKDLSEKKYVKNMLKKTLSKLEYDVFVQISGIFSPFKMSIRESKLLLSNKYNNNYKLKDIEKLYKNSIKKLKKSKYILELI